MAPHCPSVFFFFWAWKRKWAWKPILDLFLHFFTCKVSVSRPLFLAFFTFFTPNLSFFTVTYRFFWYFFTGTKKNSRAYFWEFSRVGIMFSRALFEPGNLAATTRLCREACFRYTLESENCVFVWLFVCLFVCLHKWKLNWKWIWVWQKLQPLWLEFYTFHF